ncbi:MAG: hypothetical protein J6Z34_02055 [Clostridia bacterium]|nr:hypothetical protein [Clostridia bacterium]
MRKLTIIFLITAIAASLVSLAACKNPITGEGGTDSLEISMAESKQKMEELGREEGYEVTLVYGTEEGTDGEFTFGCKGDVVWAYVGEDGYAVKKEGDNVYTYSTQDGVFQFEAQVSEEEAQNYSSVYMNIYNEWLYYGNGFDGMLKKGSDANVAGRPCHTYTFKMGDLGVINNFIGQYVSGVNLEYRINVDVEYGITMKLNVLAEAEGESNSVNFEVTSFKTGNAVTVPTLPSVPQ